MFHISQRLARTQAATSAITRFLNDSAYARRNEHPVAYDFALGNPQEMPLPGFVQALQHSVVPQNKDWFAYKMNEPEAQAAAAASLRKRRGVPFEDEDVLLTNGAFAALAVALAVVADPGDEVIFNSPPWFFYEPTILSCGAVPVKVTVNPITFDLDVGAMKAAITPRTRAVIVNSPNNPTGMIYPRALLEDLGRMLAEASERYGRPIYLLSDEAYSRIVYDGTEFTSPTSCYPNSFLLYTYGKTLLTPGQRIGYIALPPSMPQREQMREAVSTAQFITGYAFPNALLQHALPELEELSIDIAHLERKRDRLVGALREMGYDVHSPQGTFYLLPRSPLADDWAFTELLAQHDIYCLPASLMDWPGYFRISLTANDQMIEGALPGFAAAREQALRRTAVNV